MRKAKDGSRARGTAVEDKNPVPAQGSRTTLQRVRTQPQRLADDAASVYLSISCGSSYKGLLVNTVIKALEGCKVVIYQANVDKSRKKN